MQTILCDLAQRGEITVAASRLFNGLFFRSDWTPTATLCAHGVAVEPAAVRVVWWAGLMPVSEFVAFCERVG